MQAHFIIILFLFTFLGYSQEPKTYFEHEIGKHIKAFRVQTELAIQNNDRVQAEFLFDSLLNTHLKYSYISEITLKKANGGTLKTSNIKHAFLLITKSAWEHIDDKEIDAINRMSRMYKGQVDIVILFWTSKSIAKKQGSSFNSLVTVTYVNERENKANHIIASYKHSFGAPTCFFISEKKQLLDIDRKFTVNLNKEDPKVAFELAHDKIKSILFQDQQTIEGIITTLN
ncbi:hypothetical protein A9Q86_04530 [Flavobacteriales bacterium 33_180_T64]|nr:hypothetical protein A9Q86_04530 [Flavobacteriales bacterium 33_180_T64]